MRNNVYRKFPREPTRVLIGPGKQNFASLKAWIPLECDASSWDITLEFVNMTLPGWQDNFLYRIIDLSILFALFRGGYMSGREKNHVTLLYTRMRVKVVTFDLVHLFGMFEGKMIGGLLKLRFNTRFSKAAIFSMFIISTGSLFYSFTVVTKM